LNAPIMERTEALAIALANASEALARYRTLVAVMRPFPAESRDDRRTCTQCANLASDGRCRAMQRGEPPRVASYNDAPAPDVPKRCKEWGDRLDG
jgi:hypothetical protein